MNYTKDKDALLLFMVAFVFVYFIFALVPSLNEQECINSARKVCKENSLSDDKCNERIKSCFAQ